MENAGNITPEMLNKAFFEADAEHFRNYVVLVSAYMYEKMNEASPVSSDEHHSLVAEFNDYRFDEARIDRAELLCKVQKVHPEALGPALKECNLTDHEVKMVLASIQEQAFLNTVLNGGDGSKMYETLHFMHPHTHIVLKWYRGVFNAEWI